MSQHLATIAYMAFIAGLFYLDRDAVSRVSKGLWVPVVWLLIVSSRPVSMWLSSGPTIAPTDQNLDGSPIDAAVFGMLVLAGIVVLGMRSRVVKVYLRANWAILLYFSFCAISILWSDYSFIAFKRWIKAIGDLVMVLVVLTDPAPLVATKRLFSRASFLLLPISVLFIKYYPELGRAYDPWTWEPMYTGVSTFKNMLGMTCLVCGIGSLWSFMGALQDKEMPHRVRHMIANGAMIPMAFWLLKTANSMTSMACFLMAGMILILPLQKRYSTRAKIAHGLIWGAVALSAFNLFVGSGAALHSLGRDSTLTGRTSIWKAVLSMHTNPLLGAGFESFWMGSRLEKVDALTEQGIQEAHNGYIELYLNLGFAGLAFLAIAAAAGYRSAFALFRRDSHAGRLRLAFFAAGIIYSFTEAGFRMMSPIWIGFLFAITCVPPEPLRNAQLQFAKSVDKQRFRKSMETVAVLKTGSKRRESEASAQLTHTGRFSVFRR